MAMRGAVTERDAEGGPNDVELHSWVVTYGPALRRFFARRVGQSDADELVQDVFLAVHNRHAGEPVANPQGYLFRAAHRLLMRRNGKAPSAEIADSVERLFDPVSPERRLIGKQELDRALLAIQNLPPRARQAFILHRFEEMTYANIANHLGISVSGVRKLISRSLHHILAEIGPLP